jgi:RNA polymerase sigma-70 factor (ECF subfamily)
MDDIETDWNLIVESIGPDLYRYFMGFYASQTAADLVQETLIRLFKKHRDQSFDSHQGSLRNFAFGIARYIRMEYQKKGSDFHLVEDESQLDIAMPEIKDFGRDFGSDPVAHLRWALSQLKPLEQELILQMIDEEASFETIAENFQMPVGTVKSHIHRAKEKLRQLMEVKS